MLSTVIRKIRDWQGSKEEWQRNTIFITSPLEPEHVERLKAVDPERVEVIYEPDLLPPVRYIGDHNGIAGFELNEEQQARWDANVKRADILFDFPGGSLQGDLMADAAPNLKWVQTTSAGVGQMIVRMGLQDSDLLVTTASGVHAGPLAEYVFMVLLNQVKDMALIRKGREERTWERYCTDELEGKTLAIVGAGKIGRRVATIAGAFGMRTLATARTVTPDRAAELASTSSMVRINSTRCSGRPTRSFSACRTPGHRGHDRCRCDRGDEGRRDAGEHRARTGR
ncbi:MAG: NAD(P)-dependent oxidoreductase [Thermomicrobiales bacterium]